MPKLNKKDFIFADREGEELVKYPGKINGNSFVCRRLVNCDVYLCDCISTIYVDNCSNTRFYFGPVEGSVFVRKSDKCSVTAAAEQIRVSDSSYIDVYAFSLTDLALENSKMVRIAPYNFAYAGIKEHFDKMGFIGRVNNGFYVHDFTPAEGNYNVMPAEEFGGKIIKQIDEEENEPECPVVWPVYFGGSEDIDVFANREIRDSVVNPDGSISFQINVSEQEAQNKIQEEFTNETETITPMEYTYTDDSRTVKDTLEAMNKGTDLRSQPPDVIEPKEQVQETHFSKQKPNPVEAVYVDDENGHLSHLERQLKARNDKINKRLENKMREERNLKEERRRKGKEALDNFLSEYKAKVAELKAMNTQSKRTAGDNDQYVI